MTRATQQARYEELREMAEQGSAEAQYQLANAYYNGTGVTRDAAQGGKWLMKAAERGHIPAQCDLGVMYQKGLGVEQSYQDCLKWYRLAAEKGDVFARHNLGSLNAKGFRLKGLSFFNRSGFAFMKATQDYVEAYKWFSLAVEGGHSRSARDMAIIKRRMLPAQIEKAERMVAEFHQSDLNPP